MSETFVDGRDGRAARRREDGGPRERREAIVNILTREGPLTCVDLVPLMPGYQVTHEWPCPEPRYHDQTTCIHAKQTYVWKPGYSNVYGDLRRLEDEDRVIRETSLGRPEAQGGKSVRWLVWSREDQEAEVIASILATAQQMPAACAAIR